MTHKFLLAASFLILAGCSNDPQSAQDSADTDSAATQSTEITADTPITSENYAQVMEARAKAYDALEFKPITVEGFSCGDSCYVHYTPHIEGGGDATALCAAEPCSDWQENGMPESAYGKATAKFEMRDRFDSAGNKMDEYRAIIGFETLGGEMDVPQNTMTSLKKGFYVLENVSCENPANAAWREVSTAGISGSATQDCRFTLTGRDGAMMMGVNNCKNTYDRERSATDVTIKFLSPEVFVLNGKSKFRYCDDLDIPQK